MAMGERDAPKPRQEMDPAAANPFGLFYVVRHGKGRLKRTPLLTFPVPETGHGAQVTAYQVNTSQTFGTPAFPGLDERWKCCEIRTLAVPKVGQEGLLELGLGDPFVLPVIEEPASGGDGSPLPVVEPAGCLVAVIIVGGGSW